jgi:hypothetical protein
VCVAVRVELPEASSMVCRLLQDEIEAAGGRLKWLERMVEIRGAGTGLVVGSAEALVGGISVDVVKAATKKAWSEMKRPPREPEISDDWREPDGYR